MRENRTGKYFKYAIGEILLVVVGILIALQVNNWNENQIKIKKEEETLSNLLGDLKQAEIKSLELIRSEEFLLEDFKHILKGKESQNLLLQNTNRDSIFHKIIFNVITEVPVINAYSDLKSAGEISFISNNDIRKRFTTLENSINNLTRQLEDRLEVQQLRFDEIALSGMNFLQTLKGQSHTDNFDFGVENNYHEILEDTQVLNAIAIKFTMTVDAIDNREELLVEVRQLIQLIEKELEGND